MTSEKRCALSMKKDETYLNHILGAICDVEKFVEDVSEQEFFVNKEKQYAVLRALKIIGEAAKNLSPELKSKQTGVDWKNIAGMRDKLIHSYFGVNLPIVWETVKRDLPKLKKKIIEIRTNSK
jgi:uncharacterized protein with HEPN domain